MTVTISCLSGTQVLADAPSPCENVSETFPVVAGLTLSVLQDGVEILSTTLASSDPLYIATGLPQALSVRDDEVDWGFDNWANGDGTSDSFTDDFNRANAATLGAGWTQSNIGGLSSQTRVNGNRLKGASKVVAAETTLELNTPASATAIGDQHCALNWATFGGLNTSPIRLALRGNGTTVATWIGYLMIFETTDVNEPDEDHWIYTVKICHFNNATSTLTVLATVADLQILIGTFPTFKFKAIG